LTDGPHHMTRIMLVDDEESYRLLIRTHVENHPGFEIVGEALNGTQAVAMVDELKPDLVLMDISMPGMDGLRATRQIKDRHPDITVIIISALDSGDEIAAGASGRIEKTEFTLDRLLALLDS
jgi:YesN/AraC family two-component response regulator